MTVDCDVLVVGGGLSGLAAADDLSRRGWRVRLIERGRPDGSMELGGRIKTTREEPLPLELGPTYIGPTQGHMQAYVRRFGLSLQKNSFAPDKVNLNHIKLTDYLPPYRETFSGTHMDVADIERAITELDRLTAVAAKNLEAPWDVGELRPLDAQSVAEWSEAHLTPMNYGGFSWVMKKLLNIFLRSILSVEAHEISMLFFLYYCARCGGFRYMVSAVDYGPDCRRIRDGLDELVNRLKGAIEKHRGVIEQGSVVKIDQRDPKTVVVETAGGTRYQARHVIVAMPPKASITNIAYDPPLPPERVQLCKGMIPGRTWKGYVVFDTPWFDHFHWHAWWTKIKSARWGGLANVLVAGSPKNMLDALPPLIPRTATGYTGYTNGDYYTVSWTMNGTWRDELDEPALPALMWFVVGDAAARFGTLSRDDRERKVIADLKELFRDSKWPGKDRIRYYERDYTSPPYQSGPSWVMPPGLLTLAGRALREPFDRVHWAGTEAAVHWGGYLEGAVDAALRATAVIDDTLHLDGVEPMDAGPTPPPTPKKTSGVMCCGAAKEEIGAPDGMGMAGYSWAGKVGRNFTDRLYARALWVSDAEDNEAMLCFVDLMSSSRRILQRVRELAAGYDLDPNAIFIAGTHTHTAPGHFYGNSFYDFFAQAPSNNGLEGFQEAFADGVALSILKAIVAAREAAVPAKIGVGAHDVWGASRNRSLKAFANHPDDWNASGPGASAGSDLTPQQKAVDPRVRTIAAVDLGGELIASFATFGCHATALGPSWASYHRDWPGMVVDALENKAEGATFALAPSALGDVTPMKPSDGPAPTSIPSEQGEALASYVAEKVAGALERATDAAVAAASADHTVVTRTAAWDPLTEFEIGWPVMGGAEDGRSALYGALPGGALQEGMRDPTSPDPDQRPKFKALGLAHEILETRLRPADWHPLHQLQIGKQLFVSVPGEPTTRAAHELEKALKARTGVDAAHVIGCAGDYAGYYTTPAEYDMQHFEGACTLYGHRSLELLTDKHAEIFATGDNLIPQSRWDAIEDELTPAHAGVLIDRLAAYFSNGAGVLFRFGGMLVALLLAEDLTSPNCSGSTRKNGGQIWEVGVDERVLRGKARRVFGVAVPDGERAIRLRDRRKLLPRKVRVRG